MAGNNGGPWGGGGNRGNGDDRRPGGRRPGGEGPQIPEIDEIVRKGQERLKVLIGGRGGRGGGGGGGPEGEGFKPTRGTYAIGALLLAGFWAFSSFYTVRPEEQSVELFLGEFSSIGNPGLNFAPWPVMTAEVIPVTRENTEDIGVGPGRGTESGLMLTTDANIVDIGFQVVWNINDPAKFLFNIADPQLTVRAVSESAMREIIAESELAPILNRDRGIIADRVQTSIQEALDSYDSGINIVRVNLDRADPPSEVIDAFRAVQAAEQERDRLERQADAYANTVLAGARGEAAQVLEQAEAYRARVVNEAEGEASRFLAVLAEYRNAPEVTRQRLYIETIEQVLGGVDKILLDPSVAGGAQGGQGVVPYLPLNELRRTQPDTAGAEQGN
jgi:membrane protease subunit HflK